MFVPSLQEKTGASEVSEVRRCFWRELVSSMRGGSGVGGPSDFVALIYCVVLRPLAFRITPGHRHTMEKMLLRCAWSPDGKMVTAGSGDR